MSNVNELGIVVEQEMIASVRKDWASTSVFKIGPLYRWTYRNNRGVIGCEYYSCKDTAMSLHDGCVSAMKTVKQS